MHSRWARLGLGLGLIGMIAALGAPATARELFHRDTMLGWQRTTGAAAVVYGRLPFHATATEAAQPRLGLAMTAPQRATGLRLHTQAPRLVDIGVNAKGFDGAWSVSARLGATPAWSYDPDRAAGERHLHLFDSGLSWVAVGLVGAGLFAGVFMITEDDVPPRVTGP